MAEIKFYSDKAKTNQVYPELNPNGVYPRITVGLANNLTSPDLLTSTGAFIARTTGGNISLGDGLAKLASIKGYLSANSVEESFGAVTPASCTKSNATWTFTLDNTSNFAAAANTSAGQTDTYEFKQCTEVTIVEGSELISGNVIGETFGLYIHDYGTHTLVYDTTEETWTDNETTYTTAELSSEWGITIDSSATLADDDTIQITYSKAFYKKNSTQGESFTSCSFTDNGIQTSFSSTNASITEGAFVDCNFTINYTAPFVDNLYLSKPSKLISTGLNVYNKNTSLLTGYYINSSGNVVSGTISTGSESSYGVGWFKCLGGNTYTIYSNTHHAIPSTVYYNSTIPTTSTVGMTSISGTTTASSGQLVTAETDKKYFTPTYDGYICFTIYGNVDGLCCHLTWSGYKDLEYEDYWQEEVEFNDEYTWQSGIFENGLARIGEYYDEIDYFHNTLTKRIKWVNYSDAQLATIKSNSWPYKYGYLDGNVNKKYIYYYDGNTSNYSINRNIEYIASDFGMEYFTGTNVQVGTVIEYPNNLKDKLRNDVEVKNNKLSSFSLTSSETNNTINYPSTAAIVRYLNGTDTMGAIKASSYAIGDVAISWEVVDTW